MTDARPNYAMRRLVVGLVVLGVVIVIGVVVWIVVQNAQGATPAPAPTAAPASTAPAVTPTPTATPTPTSTPSPEPESPPPPPAAAAPVATCDPNVIGVLVNKRNPLCPIDFYPELVPVASTGGELRPEAAAAMDAMNAQLQADLGLSLFSASAFRSYDTQVSTYGGWVAQDGVEGADRYSARPGHSEHQMGLAMDVGASSCGCTDEPFGSTPEGQWVAAWSWQWGFIVRYPDGYESVTGYIWEPWHLRYVGVDIATAMHEQGIPTLEDYYGTGPAPDYGG